MNIEIYNSLLTRHIVALLFVVLTGLAICVVGIILVKRFDLDKWLYALCVGTFIVGVICAHDAVPLYLDLRNNDYIEYVGTFEQYAGDSRSRDNTRLLDGTETVLYSERMSLPYGQHHGRIVYAKRSHIVVQTELFEDIAQK